MMECFYHLSLMFGYSQKVHNKAIFVSFLTINDGFLLLCCKSTKIIAHNSHNYPKKFGRLENNAYFCNIKYQKSEDKL